MLIPFLSCLLLELELELERANRLIMQNAHSTVKHYYSAIELPECFTDSSAVMPNCLDSVAKLGNRGTLA